MEHRTKINLDNIGSCSCCGDHDHNHEHNHEHNHDHNHGCGHDHEHNHQSTGGQEIMKILRGAILFASGLIVLNYSNLPWYVGLIILIVAYLNLGLEVLVQAFKNILRGKVFDENFLMGVSTLGAFAIGEYPEAVAVMLFYQVGEFFQSLAVNKSKKSITELMDIRPDRAYVIRDGAVFEEKPWNIKVGEIIRVKPGERVALDGVIVGGDSSIDTRAITGESVPRSVGINEEILSGVVNLSGVLDIKVTKGYEESTASKIIEMVENAAGKKAMTEKFITKFARYYTPVVVISALVLAIVPPIIMGGGFAEWIRRGLVFLVISCPCALVISVPLSFFGGIGAASANGILVKGGNYLEALTKVGTVVFDKTGTLTKGVFKVTSITTIEGVSNDELLAVAATAEYYSKHPIALSVLASYNDKNIGNIKEEDISEYTEIVGRGISVKIKGKRIYAGNLALLKENDVDMTGYVSDELVGTKLYIARDNAYLGYIVISDEIKEDSISAIKGLKSVGVSKVVMLTGDNENIAKKVSSELNIDEYYAKLLPTDKLSKLEEIMANERRGSVIFVGDGINDAPVLARADVGIAMGGIGSDAAIEAADVVLMTDEPSKIIEAINIAKRTRKIVMQNIAFSLGVKGIILILGALGIAGMWEAVFGDVGVMLIAVINSMRVLRKK